MPKFYLVGLMHFDGCQHDRTVALLPDGTESNSPHLPPHYASLFIEKVDCVRYEWWREPLERTVNTGSESVDLLEFRIPIRAELRFPQGKTAKECVKFDDGLAKLEDVDPTFVPDLVNPRSVAEVPITGGTLEPLALDGVPVVQWTVDDASNFVIEAQALGKNHKPSGDVYVIAAKAGAEIVLSNTPDFITEASLQRRALHDHNHHFALYAKIAAKADVSKIVNAKPREPVGPLSGTKGYLKFLEHAHVLSSGGSCSATCCRP